MSTNRIEVIMNSVDGMERAEASPFLAAKIMNRIQQRETVPLAFPLRWAMVLGCFIVLNIVTIMQIRKNDAPSRNGSSVVASEYSIGLPQAY